MLERHADKVIDDGRRGLVRNGHLPERETRFVAGGCATLSDLSMAQRTSSKTHSQRSGIAPWVPRGASLNKTVLAMIYKLAGVAERAGGASTVTISCRKLYLE